MASTRKQRKRMYDGKRLTLILERLQAARDHLEGAIRLTETEDFQRRHQPNAPMILKFADRALLLVERALIWAEERVWIHEREKADRIKDAGGDAS